jgi:predicted sulfurtransferase
MGGKMSNNFWTIAPTRERCENCGRYVTDQQLWHSETLGHSVCDHCYDPERDDHYLTEFDPHATLHEITNS